MKGIIFRAEGPDVYGKATGEFVKGEVVVEGNWDVAFELGDEKIASVFRPNQKISLFGGDSKVKKVEISSISIAIEVRGKAVGNYDSASPEDLEKEDSEDELPSVSIQMKDGSFVEFSDGGQSISGSKMVLSKSFQGIIDPAEIDTITFAGEELIL